MIVALFDYLNLIVISAGGLVTAVTPIAAKCNGTWIGWSGLFDLKPNEKIPESDLDDKYVLKSNQVNIQNYYEKLLRHV